jgi:hypothetical protein
MTTIDQARRALQEEYRFVAGFVGVGIGRFGRHEVLRLYVRTHDCPLARHFTAKPLFDGFPVILEPTGPIRALAEDNG